LLYNALNKSATKYCKHFPPHLKNVSTVPQGDVLCTTVFSVSLWTQSEE